MLVCPKESKVLPLEGRLLDGKFRFAKLLGAGGMGAVWKAHNVRVKKSVAIKLMHPEFAGNPGILDRFRQEATAAGEIGSQHICDVYDFGPSILGPYIVLEMLNGRSLGELITQYGRVDPGLAAIVLRQALEGLEAAHRAGIVHRDLKPENIFLHEPSPGRLLVKLMDFGISKFSTGEGAGKTSAGVLMGTPEYMSPEQSEGAAAVDARTDIWAMGAILYKALTGVEAFAGATMAATLVAVATKEPRPITEFAPTCPPGLIAVVARCLAKSPAGRYANARELSDALAPFEQMSGSLPPPPNAMTSAGGFTATTAPATPPPTSAPLSGQTSAPHASASTTAPAGTLITRGNPGAGPPAATLITGGPGGPGPTPPSFQPGGGPTFVGNPNLAPADDSWSLGQGPGPVTTTGPSTLSGSPTNPGSGGGSGKLIVITIVLLIIGAGIAVAMVTRTPKEKRNDDKTVVADSSTPDTKVTTPDPTAGATAGDTKTGETAAAATAGETKTGETAGDTKAGETAGDTKAGETAGDTKAGGDTKDTKVDKPDPPKPKPPDMSLLIKEGNLHTPKAPGPANFKSQEEALDHCKSLRSKKFANLKSWGLASLSEARSFAAHQEISKRTYWTEDAAVAGRVKQIQPSSGKTVERSVTDKNFVGSALCVAKN
ncbi:MAG: serine/threonine protein kinase [Myxococcales bacterium]|nr:serine/threonine protein kinase [Myxococcales bacterium]